MTDTHEKSLRETITDEIRSANDPMHVSASILDPKSDPGTRLDKVFSLDMQPDNTNKYRGRVRERIEENVTIRMAHRLNPKNQSLTQGKAERDSQNAVERLLGSTRGILSACRIRFIRTRRLTSPSREWLFTNTEVGVEYDFNITTQVTV